MKLAGVWRRLPVIVRALVTGLLVYFAGSQPSVSLLLLNLRLTPAIPWSPVVIAVYLWVFWRYLNGRGWPQSTAAARRQNLRAGPVSPTLWRWSLMAGGLTGAAICAAEFLGQRFIASDPPQLPDLSQAPLPMFVLTYLTASAIAGIVEEAAYRGYMQSPIERRHGPLVGISIVAVLFTLAHYPVYPNMSLPQFLSLLAIALGYGLLARLVGSILPGVVIHAAGNAVAFLLSWWYAHATGSLRIPLYSETGMDPLVWANVVAAFGFSAAALWACRRLVVVVRRERRR